MYNALLGFLTSDEFRVEATIGGVQSGTLALGDYIVDQDITVLEGTTLTLVAGSTFTMADNVLWEIQGTLNAPGTASKPITFSAETNHWHGIRFCKEVDGSSGTLTVDTGADTISTGFTLETDWPIYFTTTGTLPAPLEPNARYYNIGGSQIAKTMGGSAIDITDSGSGTHTAVQYNILSSTGLTSSDAGLTQTMSYCVINDADKTDLPANYFSPDAYRHWVRGGGLMTYELEDMDFTNLTFNDCGAEEGGGGAYIQGDVGGDVILSDFTFNNCFSDAFPGAAYRQSHGEGTCTLTNFAFNSSVYAPVNNYPFTADASTDRITINNGGLTLENLYTIKELASSGTLPAGLAGSTVYYVRNVSNGSPNSTFQVSTTPTGSIIDITDAGSGSHTATVVEDYTWFSVSPTISGFTFS